MVWGAAASADPGWAAKLRANDPSFTSLTVMSFRPFGEGLVVPLAQALAENTTLRELSASGKPLTPAGLTALSAALESNSTLQTLRVGDQTLGDSGVEALCAGIARNKGLLHLDLSFKGFGPGGAAALADVLGKNTTLQTLDVSRNALGDDGVKALALGLAAAPALRSLNLSDTGCGPAAIAYLVEAGSLAHLRELRLANNALSAESAKHLAQLVAQCPALERLDLEATALGEGGAEFLSRIAGRVPALKMLNLSNCSLTTDAAMALVETLPTCTTISTILLRGNTSIGDAGARALAEFAHGREAAADLPAADVWEELDLGLCGLSSASLAAFLSASPPVRKLGLFGNQLGEGLAALLESRALVLQQVVLEDLDLGGNGIGDDTMLALGEQLLARPAPCTLRTLSLGGNTVTARDAWLAMAQRLAASEDEGTRIALLWQ